jgi:transposase-like protein
MSKKQVEIITSEQDEIDMGNCRQYLMLREPDLAADGRIASMDEVAQHFGVSRQTLYNWLRRWKSTGTLTVARQEIMKSKMEEIEIATGAVLSQTPAMMQEMVNIVLNGNSDKNKVDAFKVLWAAVIAPNTGAAPGDGAGESDYLKKFMDKPFDPTRIE